MEVAAFPGYAVSSEGRVRGKSGRILSPGVGGVGYPVVVMYRDGKGTTVNVHRVVATAFHGEPARGMDAAHLNGVRTDNRAVNLRWVTRAENLSHMVAHGTAQRGEQHGAARLTEADVRAIRRAVSEGATHAATADAFGVARVTVTFIVNRRRWRHVA